MSAHRISSSQHPSVRLLRALRKGDAERSGTATHSPRFLIEGPHLLEEALRSAVELEAVFVSDDGRVRSDVAPILSRLPASLIREVDTHLLDSLADADSPKGLIAIGRLPSPPPAAVGTFAPTLVADGIQDPGNLGALARVAEGAGVERLIALRGCARWTHPRAMRASAGSLLRVRVEELDLAAARLATAGRRWVALDPHRGEGLYRSEIASDAVFCVGAEGPGLSPATRAAVEHWIRIPMAGRVESLNVAVAAGVVLFEMARRRS